jgi:hypothetical protein
MESKSKACIVTSLSVAFAVMLLIAFGAHALLHPYEVGQEKSLVVPGTDFNAVTVAIWGLVAGSGAAVKSGASYLLTHFHRR